MVLSHKQQQILEALMRLVGRGETPTVREVGEMVGLRSPATVQKHLRALEQAGILEVSGKSRGIRLLRGTGIPIVGRIAAGEPITTDTDEVSVDGESGGGVIAGTAAGAAAGVGAGVTASAAFFGRGFEEVAIDPRVFLPGAAPGDLVALRVVGESMVEAGILDGDIVIIRRQPAVEAGEIAAVTIDGEGTLKRWHSPLPSPPEAHPSRPPLRGGEGGRLRSSVQDDNEWTSESPFADGTRGRRPSKSTVRLSPANERFRPIEISAGDHKDVRVFGKYIGLIRGEHLRLL